MNQLDYKIPNCIACKQPMTLLRIEQDGNLREYQCNNKFSSCYMNKVVVNIEHQHRNRQLIALESIAESLKVITRDRKVNF